MERKARRLSAILVSVILVFTLVSTTGCFLRLYDVKVSGISFSRDEITLAVGARTELNRFVEVSPRTATDKSFTAQSGDERIVSLYTDTAAVIPRIYLVGVSRGETVVTVKAQGGVSASVHVTVTYAAADEIEICPAADTPVFDGAVMLSSNTPHTVCFSAVLGENADPATPILWQVEGREEQSEVLSADEPFSFDVEFAGIHTVTASVDGDESVSDHMDVYVSDEVTGALVTYDPQYLDQKAGEYEAVNFSLSYDALPSWNPVPKILWYVGGEAAGRGTAFSYRPSSPGVFTVTAAINGVPVRMSDGGAEVKITVRGVITPQNVWVDYDNCYPSVYIRWDPMPAAAGYEIQIADADTGRAVGTDIRSDNTAISSLFTDSGFDASAYMTGRYTVFANRFTVRVKTLSDESGILEESGWSASYTTARVPAAAEPYLASKFYDGARNRYVRSFDEFYEWFEYAMLWRPSSLETGEKLYLDYAFGSAADTISRAMDKAHFTGKYGFGGAAQDKDKHVCTFEIDFRTDGAPSKRTELHATEAWGSMRPHVNYDTAKVRSVSAPFAIDGGVPVSVETSDQLYYAAQLGYAPKPVRGSAAEKLYEYARRVMRYIVTSDMTDVQKVHAVYDWIMWRVKYDDAVTRVGDLEEAVRYEAYYLESVFADGNTYGVCDAMSKAFVLMCRIEGIEALRVTGEAGSNAATRGGHAWNKVKIDGKWYVADCTWGDVSLQIMDGGAYREAATHAYFLLSDADVADTHFEDENSDFPAANAGRYPWYEEQIAYRNGTVDFLLDGSLQEVQSDLYDLAAYMENVASHASKTYTVGFEGGTNRTTSDYYAFELVVEKRWTKRSGIASSEFDKALTRAMLASDCPRGSYYTARLDAGDYTHVIVFMRSDSFINR